MAEIVQIDKLSHHCTVHFLYISVQESHTKEGLPANDHFLCCKLLFQQAAAVWRTKQQTRTESRGNKERVWKYFHWQFVLKRSQICSLWSLSRLSETVCASVKVRVRWAKPILRFPHALPSEISQPIVVTDSRGLIKSHLIKTHSEKATEARWVKTGGDGGLHWVSEVVTGF